MTLTKVVTDGALGPALQGGEVELLDPLAGKDPFPVLMGNTAADGNARLSVLDSVLDEAAEANDARQRAVVVEALIVGSGMDHFSRFLGPESHGSRPALESWRPATDREAASYVQGCATRLADWTVQQGCRTGRPGHVAPVGFIGRAFVVHIAQAFAGEWYRRLSDRNRSVRCS